MGAGAGLSTAAGLTYSGARFREHFADFIERYGFTDMYSGGFFPFPSEEERWAYWSRYIKINRYDPVPTPLYEHLLEALGEKDFFVLTTNVDHCFQRAGFPRGASSTRRATTVSGSAASRATRAPTTTRPRYCAWSPSSATCACPRGSCRAAPSAGRP